MEKRGIFSNEKCILYVGNEHPRKNVEGLVKAFYRLKKKYRRGLKIIKVGGSCWFGARSRLNALVDALGLQRDLIFSEFASEEHLIALYNAADVFVFPSFYEGFGLPVLEAMACGCPVVASNTSSLPEVVGDAGILVNPYNINGLANAMYEVLANEGLREDLTKRGLARAKRFSWEKTARETLKVYQEVHWQ
jgi:glycosyltransferase involved in cell wall biosynthesis